MVGGALFEGVLLSLEFFSLTDYGRTVLYATQRCDERDRRLVNRALARGRSVHGY
jgi:hypothetical protein